MPMVDYKAKKGASMITWVMTEEAVTLPIHNAETRFNSGPGTSIIPRDKTWTRLVPALLPTSYKM